MDRMATTTQPQQPSPELIFDTLNAYQKTAALRGAIELDLFTAIDKGAKGKREITAFNGGLFVDDPEINSLVLFSEKWTNSFAGFGRYDFSEEVNVEVLGKGMQQTRIARQMRHDAQFDL